MRMKEVCEQIRKAGAEWVPSPVVEAAVEAMETGFMAARPSAVDAFFEAAMPASELQPWVSAVAPLVEELSRVVREVPVQEPALAVTAWTPDVAAIRTAGEVMFNLARFEARHGEQARARALIGQLLDFAAAVEAGSSDDLTVITGSALRLSAVMGAHVLATHHAPVDRAELREWVSWLDGMRAKKEPYVEALKVEFAQNRAMLVLFRKGWMLTGDGWVPPSSPMRKAGVWFLLRPNETERWLADVIRLGIEHLEMPAASFVPLHQASPPTHYENGLPRLDNYYGRYLLERMAYPHTTMAWVFGGAQAKVSALQAWLAVDLFRREHGALPASLDALVPEYLAAIPMDPLEGGEIVYDAEDGRIWSPTVYGQKSYPRRGQHEPSRGLYSLIEAEDATEEGVGEAEEVW